MRPVMIGLGVLLVASVLSWSVMMMATGMGDHWRMMGGRGSDPAGEPQVAGVTAIEIQDFAFDPPNVRVPVGATITWTNRDSARHTVTSDEGDELASDLLGRGESYRHTFSQPGVYAYHCRPHPNMKGIITATER